MRDFNFKDDANTGAADIANVDIARPLETSPEILNLDETPHEESLRPFHIAQDEEESSNLPKLVGAAVVGLLIVGGGLYAYETSFAHKAPVKTVAMNTTAAPTNNMDGTTPAPSATPDAGAAPSAPPAPSVKSAAVTPAPKPELSKTEPAQSPPVQAEPAQQSASNAPGVGIGPTSDPAINAPMTLTPDTAPPAQSSSQTAEANAPAQTALQQPITTPDVGNTSQPTASIAANQTPNVTPDTSSAPAEQVTQQPAQVQPAQIQPAQIQPSQPVQ